MQPFFKMARDLAAPYQTAGRWQTFKPGDELVPDIHATDAHGHTAFRIESGGKALVIWDEMVHARAVQFARPGISIEFDIDQKQAIASRRAPMKAVAKEGF